MKYLVLLPLLLLPGLAHAESQTASTDGGILDVRITHDVIIPGESSPILIEFLNPRTGEVQEHIDYSIMLTDGDRILFGTPLTHSATGEIRGLSVTFPDAGEYPLTLDVEGILFNPIEPESAQLSIRVVQQGGGCLIATAVHDSEMMPQVQHLREIRDQNVLSTSTGRVFMETFHQVYYSFSPTVADMLRENPLLREAVYIIIQPMLASLHLMEYTDSESDVMMMGVLVILLNISVYLAIPALVVSRIVRRSGSECHTPKGVSRRCQCGV